MQGVRVQALYKVVVMCRDHHHLLVCSFGTELDFGKPNNATLLPYLCKAFAPKGRANENFGPRSPEAAQLECL